MPRFAETLDFDKEARGVVAGLTAGVASAAVSAKNHTNELYENATASVAASVAHGLAQLQNISVITATASAAAPYCSALAVPLRDLNPVSLWLFSSGVLVLLLRAIAIELKASRLLKSHGHSATPRTRYG